MDQSTSNADEAHIQLIHIAKHDEPRISQLINKLWFFYHFKTVNTPSEEARFFSMLKQFTPPNQAPGNAAFDLVIADFRKNSPLQPENQKALIESLRHIHRPLISLTNDENFTCYDEDKNWLYLSIPYNQIDKHITAVNDAITNFWFDLPSQKQAMIK